MLCKIDLIPRQTSSSLTALRESDDLLHVSASLRLDIHTYFHWDLHAHRVLPQAAASFQRVSRGDIAGIRVRHFAESEKNRNAHVAERRASPSKTAK